MSTEKSDVEIWDSITSDAPEGESAEADPVVADGEVEPDEVEAESTETEPKEDAFKSLTDMVGAIKDKLEKPAPAEEKPAAKSSTPEFIDPADRLTDDQKAKLKQYGEDYPEIKEAFNLEMQMFAERLLNFHHTRETQLVDEIKAALEPLVGMHSEYTSEKKQRSARSSVPEYDDVAAWIETQPKIVRGAYATALTEGGESRAEVLAAFKASKPSKQATPAMSETKTKALQAMKSPPKMRAPAVSDSDETHDPMAIWNKITNSG